MVFFLCSQQKEEDGPTHGHFYGQEKVRDRNTAVANKRGPDRNQSTEVRQKRPPGPAEGSVSSAMVLDFPV